MPLIKDKQLCDNTWTYAAEDTHLPTGNITVSLNRWNTEKEQLIGRSGKLGIRLIPNDSVDAISNRDLSHIDLIELDFPLFGDGRTFSQARLLRSLHGYQGEIRAVGHYLPDQVFYLHRVGVNAFEFENPSDLKVALSALNDFSVQYQASTC